MRPRGPILPIPHLSVELAPWTNGTLAQQRYARCVLVQDTLPINCAPLHCPIVATVTRARFEADDDSMPRTADTMEFHDFVLTTPALPMVPTNCVERRCHLSGLSFPRFAKSGVE